MNNLRTISVRNKNWRDKNKEELSEKHKEWRELNKDKISEKNKITFVCECGRESTIRHKARHNKSKRHINFIINQNKQAS